MNFTIDAEEADRLELSDGRAGRRRRPTNGCSPNWDGFGLAIQAYGKRALPAIDYIADLAAALDRRFMVRLVKGAYCGHGSQARAGTRPGGLSGVPRASR